MRIIAKSTLEKYSEEYAEAKDALRLWHDDTKRATWGSPNDVKSYSASASVVGENRIVFNIKGNKFRLIVKIEYERKQIYICWFGSHAEYDKIDAATVKRQ